MSKLHLVSISSDIIEDHFEDGLLDSTGCGLSNEKIGETFPDMGAMLRYLASHYNLSDKQVDYEVTNSEVKTEKMVADHSQAQNGGWFEPTEQEYADWREGKIKLYSEEFVIKYLQVV